MTFLLIVQLIKITDPRYHRNMRKVDIKKEFRINLIASNENLQLSI